MACSMEAITTNLVFGVEFFWDSVEIGFFRHSLMKSGVEDSYVFYFEEKLLCSFNASEICWIMKRGKTGELLDFFEDFLI